MYHQKKRYQGSPEGKPDENTPTVLLIQGSRREAIGTIRKNIKKINFSKGFNHQGTDRQNKKANAETVTN